MGKRHTRYYPADFRLKIIELPARGVAPTISLPNSTPPGKPFEIGPNRPIWM